METPNRVGQALMGLQSGRGSPHGERPPRNRTCASRRIRLDLRDHCLGSCSEAKLGLLLNGVRWYLQHRPSQKRPRRAGDRTTTKAWKPSASLSPGHEDLVPRLENGLLGA